MENVRNSKYERAPSEKQVSLLFPTFFPRPFPLPGDHIVPISSRVSHSCQSFAVWMEQIHFKGWHQEKQPLSYDLTNYLSLFLSSKNSFTRFQWLNKYWLNTYYFQTLCSALGKQTIKQTSCLPLRGSQSSGEDDLDESGQWAIGEDAKGAGCLAKDGRRRLKEKEAPCLDPKGGRDLPSGQRWGENSRDREVSMSNDMSVKERSTCWSLPTPLKGWSTGRLGQEAGEVKGNVANGAVSRRLLQEAKENIVRIK